jgi:hypothetical protein
MCILQNGVTHLVIYRVFATFLIILSSQFLLRRTHILEVMNLRVLNVMISLCFHMINLVKKKFKIEGSKMIDYSKNTGVVLQKINY